MQNFQENDEFRWVLVEEMFKYVKNGTQILGKAVEMVKNEGLISEETRYQRSQKRKHSKMKKKLVGLGKNKYFGGGKGYSRPKMSRSKSAPAGFGALEEENDAKEHTIKVKIVQKVDEKRKKRRKKRRDKRKKTVYHSKKHTKKHHHWNVSGWNYGGGYGDGVGGD